MLKYEGGQFAAIDMDSVIPGAKSGSWEAAIKQAGFESWGSHGNADSLGVTTFRRYNHETQEDGWLIDVCCAAGVYSTVYCPTEVDFMTCFVAMGSLVCGAEVGYITAALEYAVAAIQMTKRKDPYWDAGEMVRDIIAPHIPLGGRD